MDDRLSLIANGQRPERWDEATIQRMTANLPPGQAAAVRELDRLLAEAERDERGTS